MTVLKNKHTILLLFLLWMTITCARAQEQDPWVGTWTSESFDSYIEESDSYCKCKQLLRINKSEEGYYVRGKIINQMDPNDVKYCGVYTVTGIEGNTMLIREFVKQKPLYIVDANEERVIDEYNDITYYYKLTLRNGVLHSLYYGVEWVCYDKEMNYKKTKPFFQVSPHFQVERVFYNDEW